jgi:hypothetical protein
MSDRHTRILRVVARQRQRALDVHDADRSATDPASTARRQVLAKTAARARARLVAAEAKRRRPTEA